MKPLNFPLLRRQALAALLFISCIPSYGYDLPALPSMPAIPARQPLGSVALGDPATFSEVKMDFPIESGPYAPTWSSITSNYPTRDSAWLRQAKFGIWVHFGPQAAGQSGDWYARRLYIEGQAAYTNHIRDFGHPSTVGYKDLLQTWNPTALNPAALTDTYFNAGARFLLVQGVHHDQYDNWNSKYQAWNSYNLGPQRDILGEWRNAVRAKGMRYGVTFHHEYTWWWWQSCYRADTATTYGLQGVPYDGNLTNDPSTSLWQGMDLRKLYTINLREYAGIYNAMDMTGYNLTQGIFSNHLDFAHWYATWWALRIEDVIENYDPDFIYTDGNSTQPFSGYMSGSGYKCDAMQRVLAHYFNRTLERRGTLDTFGIIKFNPNNRGIVNTYESTYPSAIKTDQPWLGEVPVGDWFYAAGFNYSPNSIIRYLLECVSRDGAAAICIALKPDGSLDPGSVTQLQAVGNWMNINSAGIYGSRAWVIYGEGTNVLPTGNLGSSQANKTFTNADFRYTVGADGYLYAYCMNVPAGGAALTLTSLGTGDGNLAAPITSVELLGGTAPLVWNQTTTDLNITCPSSMPFQTAVCFKIGPPTIIKPVTPIGLAATTTVTASGTGLNLNWYSPEQNVTFTLKRSTSSAGPFTAIATGLTGSSYTDSTVQPGTPYYYVVAAVHGSNTSADSTYAPGFITGPTTWLSQDIGSVGVAGSLAQSGSLMLVNGSGADIWSTSDEFCYVYKALQGDGTIIARVESQLNTAPWAKAGVMVRETLNANSKYAIAYLSPSNGTALQQRTSTGGSASGVTNITGVNAPYWLRLVRSGTTFTASQSTNGTTWTTLGTTSITMATNVYVGLAVCSVKDGTLCPVVFSNVSVSGTTSPEAPTSLSAAAGDAQATLTWPPSVGATTYTLKRSSAATSGSFITVATSLTGTSTTDSGLISGSTYSYTVSAVNAVGSSVDSAAVPVTPVTPLMAWRQAHFGTILSTGSAADSADPDGDGWTNAQEFAAGTDPNDRTSVLRVAPVLTNGSFSVSFSTVLGKTYCVEYSTTLQNGSWNLLQTNIAGTGGTVQISDPAGTSAAKRFYHVIVLP